MSLSSSQIDSVFRATSFHDSSDCVRWRVDETGEIRMYVDGDISFNEGPEDLEEITPATLEIFLDSMAASSTGLDPIYLGDLYIARVRNVLMPTLDRHSTEGADPDMSPQLRDLFLAAATNEGGAK